MTKQRTLILVIQNGRTSIRREFRRAWLWFALIFVGEVVGQLVGHIIAALFGGSETGTFVGPFWQKLLIVVPSSFFMIAPCVITGNLGRKLVARGEQMAWFHLLVGVIAGIFLLVISVLTLVGIGN